MTPKQRAAQAAISFVKSRMVLGLGSGSTSECFIHALAAELRAGRLSGIRSIPTSRHSESLARQLGIPLTTLGHDPSPDLTIDGADEIDPNLDLIKGLGGALLREKIVAQASRQLIIIADSSKRVQKLGTTQPLPIEVATFAHDTHELFFRELGSQPVLRRTPEGAPFITDNGNYIYDCRFARIDDPRALEEALLHRAGVVDSGLFIGIAAAALVADENGVTQLLPPASRAS